MQKIFSAILILLFFSSCTIIENQKVVEKSELIYGVPNAAIQGFDVVAYFKENKPVMGLEIYSYEYARKVWFFSTEENLNDFIDNEESYAPQYDGYCAYCVATKNKKSEGSSDFWKIVDGKLYLNARKDVHKLWLKNYQKFIKQADENWKTLKKK